MEERARLEPTKKEEKDYEEEARRRKRMAAYIRRKAVEGLPPGPGPYGYVSKEDLLRERAQYANDLKLMMDFMVYGYRGFGEAGRFKGLQHKYAKEYAELYNEKLGYGNYHQDPLL